MDLSIFWGQGQIYRLGWNKDWGIDDDDEKGGNKGDSVG